MEVNTNVMNELQTAVVDMIKQRDVLEDEIADLNRELLKCNVTMTEPLVDDEGYPRCDVDICTIRHIRHEIICKQNDFRDLTDRIGKDLFALHSAAKVAPSASCLNVQEIFLKPFARVQTICENTPAALAGLKEGDLIVKFGPYKYKDFDRTQDFTPISALVRNNVQRPIYVNVLRDQKVERLVVTPTVSKDNSGHLGCRIIPLIGEQKT